MLSQYDQAPWYKQASVSLDQLHDGVFSVRSALLQRDGLLVRARLNPSFVLNGGLGFDDIALAKYAGNGAALTPANIQKSPPHVNECQKLHIKTGG